MTEKLLTGMLSLIPNKIIYSCFCYFHRRMNTFLIIFLIILLVEAVFATAMKYWYVFRPRIGQPWYVPEVHKDADVSVSLLSNLNLSQRLIGELIGYPWSGVHGRSCRCHQQFQTSSPLKLLGLSKPNFMKNLLGKGEPKFV